MLTKFRSTFRSQFRPAGTRRLTFVFALVALLAAFGGIQAAQAQSGTCKSSSNSGYTVTVCITAPAAGATVSGLAPVTATATVSGSSSGIGKLLFSLDGAYLLTDFESPYTFQLPTTNFANGSHTISVSASMRDGFPERRTGGNAQLFQRHHPHAGTHLCPNHARAAPCRPVAHHERRGRRRRRRSQRRAGHPDDRRLEP